MALVKECRYCGETHHVESVGNLNGVELVVCDICMDEMLNDPCDFLVNSRDLSDPEFEQLSDEVAYRYKTWAEGVEEYAADYV